MKSRAFYNKDQFWLKIHMKDEVWDDMDDEMLSKVDEFEKELNDNLWSKFVKFMNLPHTYLKEDEIKNK